MHRSFILILFLISSLASASETPSAKLQIINASTETIDVYWLDQDDKEVPQKPIEPNAHTIISTTLGHRFAIVGQKSKTRREVKSELLVQAVRYAPDEKDGIPNFYTQRIKAGGFPIVASTTVNPYALKEAAYLVNLMLIQRTDIREAMIQSGARICIMAYNEYTTDLPEFQHFSTLKSPLPGISAKNFWDVRARGTGGSVANPLCTCGEENLLGYEGDPYHAESILIHEFAHNIHLRGMLNVDPTFDQRLQTAYQEAMKKGLWKNKYAATNHFEYFAEGVQSWFNNNRENDHDHNHVNTREELIAYDPVLAAFCKEVFRDTEFTYTKPATRLTGHLEGYDPTKAPTFKWPARVKKAQAAMNKAAQDTDQGNP